MKRGFLLAGSSGKGLDGSEAKASKSDGSGKGGAAAGDDGSGKGGAAASSKGGDGSGTAGAAATSKGDGGKGRGRDGGAYGFTREEVDGFVQQLKIMDAIGLDVYVTSNGSVFSREELRAIIIRFDG